MKLKKPKALKKGDTIHVVASSSPFDKTQFLKGVAVLKRWGFRVRYHKGIFKRHPYLAGSDKRRARELIHALNNKAAAILFARGGYGSMRLLSLLDNEKITGHPKVILGYSDVTSLLIYLQKRLGWVNFYGPVVAGNLGANADSDTLDSLYTILTSTRPVGPYHFEDVVTIKKGRVRAPLVGGCLSLVTSLLGTQYELNTDNKILFLEDVNERPYEVDRMLMHLKLAGKLKKCRGLIFGPFVGPNPAEHYLKTVKDIVSECNFPVVFNFPAGHGPKKLSLPLGIQAELDATRKTLTFLEGALK